MTDWFCEEKKWYNAIRHVDLCFFFILDREKCEWKILCSKFLKRDVGDIFENNLVILLMSWRKQVSYQAFVVGKIITIMIRYHSRIKSNGEIICSETKQRVFQNSPTKLEKIRILKNRFKGSPWPWARLIFSLKKLEITQVTLKIH